MKTRVTLTIDKDIHDKAKQVAKEKHISISGLVEKYLEFFGNSWVYCFYCGEKFYSSRSELCSKCGYMKCTECNECGCELDEDVISAVFHMRRVYEDLITGRVK